MKLYKIAEIIIKGGTGQLQHYDLIEKILSISEHSVIVERRDSESKNGYTIKPEETVILLLGNIDDLEKLE